MERQSYETMLMGETGKEALGGSRGYQKQLPFGLQVFAEGAGDEGGDSGGGDPGGKDDPPLDFDGFLKQEGNQAEFDRRVQQAVNTAVKDAKDKWEIMTDDKVSEAEKLAKMNKEEKAEYLSKKREAELSAREAAVTKKELMAESRNTLAEKKLPTGLAEVLDYTDADSCKKSLEAVEKAFQEAVESAVKERLKGGEPPKKAPGEENQDILAKQVEALMRGGI